MSLRYDINFNRRALAARARLRLVGLLRTLGISAFAGSLLALLELYALLVSARHQEVGLLARESLRRPAAAQSRPQLVPTALEVVMAAKASPELWIIRLQHLAQNMPEDGVLDEFEGDAGKQSSSPSRSAAMTISGHFPVPPGEASVTRPLTRWMDALQADSTFHRGVADLRLESSRVVTGTAQRAVEFTIVAR